MSCFDSEELAAWASGRLDTVASEQARAHLAECSECRLLCDLLDRGAGWRTAEPSSGDEARTAVRPATGKPTSLKPGDRLGPYLLLEWVGQGGMGDVFAAYDARLDRRVALKVLGGSADEAATARILHEARAMAQLNHPNVATVFDVGEAGGIPFLAMEFLPGGSLREWQSKPRTRDATLQIFADIARGLAHAHARGVIHRDFKPTNVVFDAEGVPRVTDFGLASRGEAHESGIVVGTRGYVSPEIERGAAATPASDQFSFGVALRQALAATSARVGPRMTAVLDQLTASLPAKRFASMDEAAAALIACQPSTRRRKLRTRIAALLAIALAVAAGAAAFTNARRCDEAGAPARGLAAELARRVPLALAALERRTGAQLSAPVVAELERQLRDWERLANEACETRAPAKPACATLGLDAVSSYVGWLENLPPAEPAIAWDRLMELPSADICRQPSPDSAPEWSAQTTQVQAVIARGPGAIAFEASHPLSRALVLNARVAFGGACSDEALLQEAISAARRVRHPIELKLWGQLAGCQSARGGLREAAFSLGMGQEVASALSPSAPARISFDLQRVRVLNQGGSLDEAEALAGAVVETTRVAVGEEHWLNAVAHERRAEVWMMRGRFSEVAGIYRRAIPVLGRAFGVEDPRTLGAHHNLGSALAADHRYEEAASEYLPLLRREGGWKSSPLTSDLAPVMLALGQNGQALALARAAISEIPERDPTVFSRRSQQLMAWARVELAVGSAEAVLQRMRATLEVEPLGPTPFDSAHVYRIFEAGALRRLGRPRAALTLLDWVRPRLRHEQKLTPNEHLLAAERVQCLVDLGKTQEARRELDELELDSPGGVDPLERVRLWQLVARALETEGKTDEASQLSNQARRAMAAVGPRGPGYRGAYPSR